MKTNCPHCGKKIEVVLKAVKTRLKSSSKGVTLASSHTLQSAIPMPTEPSLHRESPAFLPTKEAHVIVPLQQAIITGALLGPIIGILTGIIGYYGDLRTIYYILLGIGSTFATFLVVCFWQWTWRTNSYNELLWRIEDATGLDINQDNSIGKPEPEMIRVELQEHTLHGNRWQFADIPISRDKLEHLADSVLNLEDSFSERTGKAADMTQDEFRTLRNIFIDRGWATWNNSKRPQQGVSLTRGGRFVLRQMLAN